MLKRLVPLVILAAVLIGLILYSQFRPTPNKVSGILEADEIRLGSRVGGRVADVRVQEGDDVEPGQVLLELEPYDLLEKQREWKSNLAARQAELDRLEAGYRPEEIEQAQAHYEMLQARLEKLRNGPREQEIQAARNRLEFAQAERNLANQIYQRTSELFNNQAASEEDYEKALSTLQVAEASLAVRQQELDLLLAGTRPEEIAEARAALREAEAAWKLLQAGYRSQDVEQARAARDAAAASLAAIDAQLKELAISSPVSGTVEALELQPGDLVPPNAPVLSLMDRDALWVRAYVPENQLDLALGEKLRLTVDSYPGRTFLGHVTFVARQGEFIPSNAQTPEERVKQVFRIKVRVEDPEHLLRPGMVADVWLDKNVRNGAK